MAHPADLRQPADVEVLESIARRDGLALAHLCAATLPAAYAVARRTVPPEAVEQILLATYRDLWEAPPTREDAALEALVRTRCFTHATEFLRRRNIPPTAPSVRLAAAYLPRPRSTYTGWVERTLDGLDDAARAAVVLAHDAGVASSRQDSPDAGRSLIRGLLALAESDDSPDALPSAAGDLVLGLLTSTEAAATVDEIGGLDRGPNAAALRALRRGRHRLEGLAPPAHVGLRLLAQLLERRDEPPSKPAEEREAQPPSEAQDAQPPSEAEDLPPPPEPPPRAPADHDEAPGADEAPAAEEEASTGARERVILLAGGVILVVVGLALGLLAVGPFVADWLDRMGG